MTKKVKVKVALLSLIAALTLLIGVPFIQASAQVPTLPETEYVSPKTPSEPVPYDGVPLTPSQITSANYRTFGLTDENWSQYNGYYAIRNAKELYGFAALVRATDPPKQNAVLLADIVINTTVSVENGATYTWDYLVSDPTDSVYTDGYGGTFDGNGYSISGIYMPKDEANLGIIGGISGTGVVKNLVLKNSVFIANGSAATIACNNYGMISSCRIESSVILHRDSLMSSTASGIANAEQTTQTVSGGRQTFTGGIENCFSNVTLSLPATENEALKNAGVIASELDSKTKVNNNYGIRSGEYDLIATTSLDEAGKWTTLTTQNDAHTCIPITHNQVNGTCEHSGLSAHTYCAVCLKVLSGEKTVLYGHVSDEFFYTQSKTDWTLHDKRHVCCTEIAHSEAHTFVNEQCSTCGYELLIRESYSENVYAAPKEQNVTLTADLTLPEGDTLWIPSGYTLTVPEGIVLTINGDLINAGTLNNAGGTIMTGEYSGVGTVNCQPTALYHPTYNEDGFCSFCSDETHPEAAPLVDGYYQIGNVGQLMWFSNHVGQGNASANAKLTADIVFNEGDLSGLNGKTDGYRLWTPIGMIMNHDTGIDSFVNYTGTFDGDGHTISGLYHFDYWSYGGFAGLVSKLGQGGVIKNVTIKDSYFATSSYVGAILGENRGGTVENCHNVNTTIASAARAGGIVGDVTSGTVRYCTNRGAVKFFMVNDGLAFGFTEFGGIAGNVAGTLEYCTNYGDITGNEIGGVGGITGQVYQGIVRHCVNEGDVTVGDGTNFGGITGYQYHGTLSYNINYGTIQGGNLVGGIIGNPLGNGGRYTHNYTVSEKAVGVGSYSGCFTITEAELANGRLAFELGIGQQIGVDARPYVGGPAVYAFFDQQGTLSYTNDAAYVCHHAGGTPTCTTQAVCQGCRHPYGEIPEGLHDLEYTGGDWVLHCTICGGRCGEVQPHDTSWSNYCRICGDWFKPELSEDGFYEIASIGNLLWFAEQVNAGNYALNARLINNIVGDVTFRNYQWVPIGGSDVDDTTIGYEGVFDGQGYAIALFPEDMLVEGDAVMGLFGTLKSGAVVKNLSISNRIDGYLSTNGTTYTYDGEYTLYFGLIAGRVLEGATVSGCRVANSTVSISNGVLGGIVGINYGTVENCVSYGMTLSGPEGRVGGIVGDYNGGTVENCYTTHQNLGSTAAGFVGTAVSCEAGIEDARMASGEIAYKMNAYVGDASCWYQNVGEGGPLCKSEDKHIGKIVYKRDFGAIVLYSNNEGKFVLKSDCTIPAGATLTVPKGIILEIAEGVTLTNQGTLIVNGTLQGKGTLAGEGTFSITDLEAEHITVPADFTFDGANHYDEIVGNLESKLVIMGKTFAITGYTRSLDFTAVQDAGQYTVTYASASETITLTFRVNVLQLEDAQISLESTTLSYNGTAQEPLPLLQGYSIELGRDYYVTYENNVSAGEATATIHFRGNYAGEFTRTFTIQKVEIGTSATAQVPDEIIFTGLVLDPVLVTVNGVALVRDVDYTVEYQNNVYPGTATAVVVGIGSVTGQATLSFEISKPAFSVTVLDQILPYHEDSNVKSFDHTKYEGEGLVEGHTVVLGAVLGGDEEITVVQILDANGIDVLEYYDLTILAKGKYHMFYETYRWDTTDGSHWRECVYNCDEVIDFEPHHGGTATCTDDAICIDCGVTYEYATGEHTYVNGVCACGYDPGYVLVVDQDGNGQHSGSETGYSAGLIHMIFYYPDKQFVVVKDFEGEFAGVGQNDSTITLDLFGHTIDMTNGMYGLALQAENLSVIFKSTVEREGKLIGATSVAMAAVTFTLDHVRLEGSLYNNGTIYVQNGASLYAEITNNGTIYLPEGYDISTIVSYSGSGKLYVGSFEFAYNAESGKLECAQDHAWVDADCTHAKHCSRCQATEGEALGHESSGPATCEADEYCTVCDSVITPRLGHSPETTPAVDPDCENVGYTEGTHCARCDHVIIAPEEIPATGHTEGETVEENRTAPTCTQTGSYENVVYCTVCNAELSREQAEVEALGHTEGEIVVENQVSPNCTEAGGYDNVTYCTVCNAELSREHVEIEATGHTMGGWHRTVEPTCTQEGQSRSDCEICDYYETEVLEALGHSKGTTFEENLVDPTCTEQGSYDRVTYCGICSEEMSSEHVTTEALGHGESEIVVENNVDSTCTQTGSYENAEYCLVCRAELSRETVVTDALGHNMGAWHQTVAPTCTDQGQSRSDCSRCDHFETETVSALGHTEGEAVERNRTEPTCTQNGSHDNVVFCTVCHEELSRQTVVEDALGHNHGEAVEENRVEPTCIQNGIHDIVVYCTVCYTELSRDTAEIDALGHSEGETVTENSIAATCTQSGSYENVVYCTVCREELSRETIITDALGHSEGETVTENSIAATCTQNGSHENVVYCTVCREELSRETIITDAQGHTEETDAAIAPTCTETGLTEGKHCATCKEVIVAQEIVDALGHTEEDVPGKDATCTEAGLTDGKKCTVCGTITDPQQEIPATGHDYDAVQTAPTCTQKGYTTYTCHCGDHYTADEVAALGHSYGDWVVTKQPTATEEGSREQSCAVCGDTVTESIPATGEQTTEEITTEEITTEEITTEEITTEEITTEEITTEDVTTDDVTTEDVTTEDLTTQENTTGEITIEDVTTENATTQEVPTEPRTDEEQTSSESESSCNGVLGAGAILLILVMGIGIAFKKRED